MKIIKIEVGNARGWVDLVFVVKNIIVIFRKIKTILILIILNCYFSNPEKSILNLYVFLNSKEAL